MPESPDRVLSTLNRDGSRRWLDPKPSKGPLWRRRQIVGFLLIGIFIAIPWIRIGGKPAILLDLPAREFTFFGTTLLPTDTILLGLGLATVFVTIFLLTALLGRVWCGWACPQTVYMEFVFRPIERLFNGPPSGNRGKRGAPRFPGARVVQHVVYLIISLLLAHVFLAYFVGTDTLFDWMQQSPFQHPKAFLIVAAVTVAIMFDFSFFREQLCIVACPYGRFQSVMLDRNSLVVSYDPKRGEPRGRAKRSKDGDVALPQLGDCVDCTMCVQVCPTGIDIRDGLQMECVNCTQCIDACNDVMAKLKRPLGLIRFSSQNALEIGKAKLIRPRVVLYPLFLVALLSVIVTILVNRAPMRFWVRPAPNTQLYVVQDDGLVRNTLQVRMQNRADRPYTFSLTAVLEDGTSLGTKVLPQTVDPGEEIFLTAEITAPPSAFTRGRARCELVLTSEDGYTDRIDALLQGPWGSLQPTSDDASAADATDAGTAPDGAATPAEETDR